MDFNRMRIEACIRPGGSRLAPWMPCSSLAGGWSSKRLELGRESWAHSDSLALLGALGVPDFTQSFTVNCCPSGARWSGAGIGTSSAAIEATE